MALLAQPSTRPEYTTGGRKVPAAEGSAGAAARGVRLSVPEDREQHSQDEDGGDDEQVVADYLIEADGGGDLGATGRAEQQRRDDAGCRAEERQEEPIGQAGDHPAVALVGEQPHVEGEPALLQRAGDAVEPAWQPTDHRKQLRQLVRGGDRKRVV